MRVRKKPVEVEAVQLRWDTWDEMCAFAGVGKLEDFKPQGHFSAADGSPMPQDGHSDYIGLWIPTLEGLMFASQNDWVIKGVKGEFYPCKPDIFEQTYERVV